MTQPKERTKAIRDTRWLLGLLAGLDEEIDMRLVGTLASQLMRHFPTDEELSLSATALPTVWARPAASAHTCPPLNSISSTGPARNTAQLSARHRKSQMNMRNNRSLDPKAPTLYVGYSSVLHVGEGFVDEDGRVKLDSGREPFEMARLLVDTLRPYRRVQLVLTTAWTQTLGEAKTASMLPEELRDRVVGSIAKFPGRFDERRDGVARTGSIIRHASAHGIVDFLALGDDLYGVPIDMFPHFLHTPSETGLATPEVLESLERWLFLNASY